MRGEAAMPSPGSPERAAKRSRTLPVEAREGSHVAGGAGGDDGRSDGGPAAGSSQAQAQALREKLQQQTMMQALHEWARQAAMSEQQTTRLQPLSQSQRQPQQPQPDMLLPSGAAVALPMAVPPWAQEALRGVDPFWQPKETLAVVVTQLAGPAPGTHGQLQSASALFTVSPAALAAIAERRAQARLVCVQPSDKSPCRCHWYGGSHALLNGRLYNVTKEERVELWLGPNQADQAADLSGALSGCANRLTLLWPVGVAGAVAVLRLCEPRSPADLRRLLAPPLPLSRVVELVRAHVAGGPTEGGNAEAAAADAATSGGDAGSSQGGPSAGDGPAAAAAATLEAEGEGEVAALGCGPVTVSLRCPLSGGLTSTPAHFGRTAAAAPLAFFDLEAFLELAQRSGSWACPASGRLGNLEDLRPHAFLTAVLRTLDHNGVRGRVEAIEVTPCGKWRPKDSRVPLLSALDADPAADPAGRPLPSFDARLLDPEDAACYDVVDLTDD